MHPLFFSLCLSLSVSLCLSLSLSPGGPLLSLSSLFLLNPLPFFSFSLPPSLPLLPLTQLEDVSDWLSTADLIQSRVMKEQAWHLAGYCSFVAVAVHRACGQAQRYV